MHNAAGPGVDLDLYLCMLPAAPVTASPLSQHVGVAVVDQAFKAAHCALRGCSQAITALVAVPLPP